MEKAMGLCFGKNKKQYLQNCWSMLCHVERKAVLQQQLSIYSYLKGKKHWLLVDEDTANFVCSYFLNEKLELKNVMMSLIKEWKKHPRQL